MATNNLGTGRDLEPWAPSSFEGSKLSPERQELLTLAELDYVNGVQAKDGEDIGEVDENGLHWPSYVELAAKYRLPQKLVESTGKKHRWPLRKERRITALLLYRNEKMRRELGELHVEVSIKMQQNLEDLTFISQRKIYEMKRAIAVAQQEEADALAMGDPYHIAVAKVKSSEIESATRALKNLIDSERVLAQKIVDPQFALPAPVQAPEALLTAEQEEDAMEPAVGKVELADVIRELRMVSEMGVRSRNSVIEGELVEEDEDEEYAQAEVVAEAT